ncbi:hypothetical protein J8L73_08960 [Pseudoalteromonas sp. MMG006]|uniref:hypothetical protein n=1 Tax=Pseudoalteromonas sp. MMG006 TaxID=2822683 RepID=UPI001B393904|nr:hypothetical protein [Pseudoalteromonas sp. MMG006]MBQ4799260.1 hypothetical protein [Pseudoalteromonas sp. MMG006]
MKKFISKRESIESAYLWIAALLIFIIMLELLTGWSMGSKSSPSQSLKINPEQFWFEIKLHCGFVSWAIFRAFITFPLFRATYNGMLRFREKRKIIANILFYVLTPILVVFLFLTLLYITGL